MSDPTPPDPPSSPEAPPSEPSERPARGGRGSWWAYPVGLLVAVGLLLCGLVGARVFARAATAPPQPPAPVPAVLAPLVVVGDASLPSTEAATEASDLAHDVDLDAGLADVGDASEADADASDASDAADASALDDAAAPVPRGARWRVVDADGGTVEGVRVEWQDDSGHWHAY